MSDLQAHHCMTPEAWTCLMCTVSVVPVNKLSLQEINQLIGIELLTSSFLEIFGSSVAISTEGQMPMVLTYYEFKTVCLISVQRRTRNSHSFRICMFSNNVDL